MATSTTPPTNGLTSAGNPAVSIAPLSLPKGGGSIQAMSVSPGGGSPTGVAEFTLPLPISAGCGYAPELALHYNSGAGNGIAGVGWTLSVMTIARRTPRGVPRYDDNDEFIGPDGEVLVPELGSDKQPRITECTGYGGVTFPNTYKVCRYSPRIEGSFDRIERWWREGEANSTFWLVHGSDGQLHCLGKTADGRLACADTDGSPRIAEWRLEESVSPVGEHIVYAYKAEDIVGLPAGTTRGVGVQKYLSEVRYGNLAAASDLYLWQGNSLVTATQKVTWLFSLVFEYAPRPSPESGSPDLSASLPWPPRQDAFSNFHYGFEVRCYRLLRQVLMLHQNFTPLNSGNKTLVSRLQLGYTESPYLTQLQSAQRWAYDTDGVACCLPPLIFDYAAFNPPRSDLGNLDPSHWIPCDGLPGMDDGHPFQLVDLHGEGLPGLLYHLDNGWHYRAPERDPTAGGNPDKVAYAQWQALPQLPAMQSGTLIDIDGNGRLDWLVAQPGMAGYFVQDPERRWSDFIPFKALPSEFFHPQAQLADLLGAGLNDLAMIGPSSVRVFPQSISSPRDGWDQAREVRQQTGIQLPQLGRDPSRLVAFADLLGSCQPHLVEISYNSVQCWPNLGGGRFGAPIQLNFDVSDANGFDAPECFDPQRLYLADLDGSGAADIIYATADALHIYRNQSGVRFSGKLVLPLPTGIGFDNLCRLQAADLDGRGTLALLLSVPYGAAMRHWRYDVCTNKPYLLTGINNNMGAATRLQYRSSVQFWLDAKQQAAQNAQTLASRLPFPIQTLSEVKTTDEISGNVLVQKYRYYHGLYDGLEREFRGFGLVEAEDTDLGAQGTDTAGAHTPPILTRSWYHTGLLGMESALPGQPWNGDTSAYTLGSTLYTNWSGTVTAGTDSIVTPDATTAYWLARAQKGQLLRQEVFGKDSTLQATVPYLVTCHRYQVRQQQAGAGGFAPVVLPGALETLTYHYERISSDPQISHRVEMQRHYYGQPLHSVEIHYPRRAKDKRNALDYAHVLPDGLPSTKLTSTVDEQQSILRITEHRQSYYQLDSPQQWQLGIPWQSRTDAQGLAASNCPAGGLSFEKLAPSSGLLGNAGKSFLAQQVLFYREGNTVVVTPTRLPVLLDHTETAELDESMLTGNVTAQTLTAAGYTESNKVLNSTGGATGKVWVSATGYATYDTATRFYRIKTQKMSEQTGMTKLIFNPFGLLFRTFDSLHNRVNVDLFDYRFLTPTKVEDFNENTSCVANDVFGRSVAQWYYGAESNSSNTIGFGSPLASDQASTSEQTLIDLALATPSNPLTVASRCAYALSNWMGLMKIRSSLKQRQIEILRSLFLIVPDGTGYRYTSLAYHWAAGTGPLPSFNDETCTLLRGDIQLSERLPPQVVIIQADRYPNANYYKDQIVQKIAASVHYSDGFGRVLAVATLDEAGLAYKRTSAGTLGVNNDGTLEQIDTAAPNSPDRRWAHSGRIEYDNKGHPVRVYQPFFVNDWRYVNDRSLRASGYADTHYYDALGREIRVETALGYLRRTTTTPWFVVAEDENDTVPDVSGTPSLAGTATVGQTLTASTSGMSVTNATSAGTSGWIYQWYRNATNTTTGGTLITGATGNTYLLTSSEQNKYVYVTVQPKRNDMGVGTVTTPAEPSSQVAWAAPNVSGTPTVTGKAEVGQTLAASGLSVSNADHAGTSGWVYQWYRNSSNITSGGTPIDNATSSAYTLTSLEDMKYVYVTAQPKRDGTGVGEVKTSGATLVQTVMVLPNDLE